MCVLLEFEWLSVGPDRSEEFFTARKSPRAEYVLLKKMSRALVLLAFVYASSASALKLPALTRRALGSASVAALGSASVAALSANPAGAADGRAAQRAQRRGGGRAERRDRRPAAGQEEPEDTGGARTAAEQPWVP